MTSLNSPSTSTSASTSLDTTSKLNTKVLKRHDPSITSIIYSASFVVLYQYSSTSSWSKTGIEGPMFLYKRSISPHYGMFVLNRNGVDNFAVPLTADDELDLSEQFVILRTQEETILEEDEEDEETIVGVWVFEKEQRQLVGEAMLNIQSMAREEDIRDDEDDEENDEKEQSGSSSLTSGANVSQPHSGSISLDALFASGKSTPSQSSTNNNGTTSSGGGPALLDAIFQSASTPKSTPKPANQQVAPAPHADSTPTPSSASASVDAANDLMAMLGLKAPPNTTTTTNGHDPSNPPPIAKDTHAEPPQNLRDTSVNLIDDAMASKHDPTTAPPLSKGEFVREVLSLIHTDKSFTQDLYDRYLARHQ